MATELMADTTTAKSAQDAYALAQKMVVQRLWRTNSSSKVGGFFGAHSETSTQVFTDTMYGAMLMHHFFNGSLPLEGDGLTKLKTHLAYEWEQNQDLYGMRVLSSPVQEDSIWMNGPPTIWKRSAIDKLSAE